MTATAAIVQGTLNPDGTLVLDQKPHLAPGRVQVMVQPLPELPADDPFWQRMQAVWHAQAANGHVPRSVEEVEAERREMRDEWEERSAKLEGIKDKA
jgi:hypothetical protein